MNLFEGFFFAFAIQSAILALFLFLKKSSQKYQNRIWSIFLILFSLNLIYNVLYWVNSVSQYSIFLSWGYALLLSLYGPLFFFYIRSLISKRQITLKKDFYHFTPFLFVLINFIRYYILPLEEKTQVYLKGDVQNYTLASPFAVCFGLSIGLIFYSFLTYRMGLKKYWNDIEMKAWSNSAVIFFLVFALSWVIFYIITTSGLYTPEADYIISFAMVLMIGLTTYFGFFHSDVFNGKPLKKIFPAIKYKNSGLSKKVMIDLKEKLSDVITNEQLYLDCELKLIDLADKLNISRHHASQVINESYGVSFYAFINKLRIEEAEKILTDTKYKNLNITDIAFKCGFNNRVSFYNSFRKHVGMTPLDFRSMKMRAAS